jgi:ATPase family associated with various cellular activities (AAA)
MEDKKIELDHKVIPAGQSIYGINAIGLYLPRALKHHLDTNCPLDAKNISGTLSISIEELSKFMEENGGTRGVCQYDNEFNYLWGYSFINYNFSKKTNAISITGYLMTPELIEMMKNIETNFVSKSKKDLVFSIVKSSLGLDIKNMGNGSSPLVKDNYNPEVIDDLDSVIECFKKASPTGRICILNGEPGTGKTHLVRSMLSAIDNVYLIVPSNLISALDSPEFLPLLLRVKDNHEKPIILIIEDGDACLVPRKSDNISTITSLLNLSDGILGSIIDIKMIITTNASIKDMDQAIMRPGRLCKNIDVNALSYERANARYRQLMENPEASLEYKKYYTLAELYNVFNKGTNTVTSTSSSGSLTKRMIGFQSSIGFAISKSDEADKKYHELLNEVAKLEEIAKKKGLL